MSGWQFYGNLVSNSTTGVLLGGGRRNIIHSNRFENNKLDIAFDNRGMNWESQSCQYNCNLSLGTSCFRGALEDVHYKQPPYSTRWPELVQIYQDHPCVPVGNQIENNTYCHDKVKGQFINRDAATVSSWFSTLSNNKQQC